jgi:hypothetical protein
MASDGQTVRSRRSAPARKSGTYSGSTWQGFAAARQPAATRAATGVQAESLVNKYLNDSGKPDQFRVDPSSNGKTIQQINPPAAGGWRSPASQFAALARSVGPGLVSEHA